jgi:hypothetical protein
MKRLLNSALLASLFAATFTALLFLFLDLWIVREALGGGSEWNPRVLIPGALLVVSLVALPVVNIATVLEYLTSRRAYVALLFGANVAAAIGLAAGASYLSARHYRTFDWTFKGIYAISERTESVLRDLPRVVTANVVGSAAHPFFPTVRGTLDIYKAAAGAKLDVEYLDPANDRQRLLAKLRALGVDPKEIDDPDVVIFECASTGAGAPRTKHVPFRSVVETESRGMGGDDRITAFKVEQEFTEAILSVSSDSKTKVLLLAGHEELEPWRRSDEGQIGLLERTLRQLNFEVDTFTFDFAEGSGKAEVPADCGVLVVAGPRSRFADKELDAMRAYLDRGGRALILAEPVLKQRPGTRSVFFEDVRLGGLLAEYGIKTEPSYIFDPSSRQEFALAAKVDAFASHPVVKPLAGYPLVLLVAQPLVVEPPDAAASKVKVQSILDTSAAAVAVRDMNALDRGGNPFAVDHRKGPLCVAAAATKEVDPPTGTAVPTGTAAPAPGRREARLIVAGDASFATDGLAGSVVENLDFAVNCISWLASREGAVSIGSKKPEQVHLNLDADQQTRVKLLAMLILPVGCAMIGLAVFVGRRS